MKKLLIILALTVLNTVIYAQKVFDEGVAKGMLERMAQDPVTFFTNETDPNFTLVFDNGTVNTAADLLKNLSNLTYKRDEISQKIRQLGNTAIVSGIVAESFYSKTDPTKLLFSDKEVYTYTYALNKKKWLLVAGQHTQFQADKIDDEAAINKTIIEETVAADAADYKAYMSHWSKNNKSSFLYSAGLFVGDSLWKKMDQVFATRKPVKFNRERSNMNIKINGSSAFVTFNQATTNIETGNKTYSNEERYLEKINEVWKFVNVTVRANNPLFTASTWKDILNEYKTDSKLFFNSRISDDFRYPLANGSYLHKDDVNAWEKQNILSSEFLEPIIFQSNDLAVVTGKHITKHEEEKGRAPRTDNVAATYTFQRRGGKWMFVASQQAPINASILDEEASIKSTIESETLAGWVHDTEKEFSYWKQAPEASWIGGVQNKAYSFVGFENIKKTAIDMHKNVKVTTLPTLKNTDYSITINGNSAFATYVQAQTSKGKTGKSRENRYLEKSNGAWKIVNATFIVDGVAK